MIDWRHWHNEPWLIGGLVVLGWLWAVLAGPLRDRAAGVSSTDGTAGALPFPRRQAWCFHASLIIFYLAVGSPLDQIGERFLFSAHMLQHQLLMYPAALLFLLGLPSWMIDGFLARSGLQRVFALFTNPLGCALIFSLVISLWHAPTLYDLALRHKLIHVAEHIMFFVASLFYWWPIASPSRILPPSRRGVQMLYLVAVLIAMTPVFAYITFSEDILYPTYEYAPRLFAAFSAADDQLLAGVMMKIVGMIVAFSAFGWVFFRWYEEKK